MNSYSKIWLIGSRSQEKYLFNHLKITSVQINDSVTFYFPKFRKISIAWIKKYGIFCFFCVVNNATTV
jgi:hypothetical protein